MSTAIMNANHTDKPFETGKAQELMTPEPKQGALYKVSKELQEQALFKIEINVNSAKLKTHEWIKEARKAGADSQEITKIIESIAWTARDIAEVAAQPTQLETVNLQRKSLMLQVQCCDVIRIATKSKILAGIGLANQKINQSDRYQVEELRRIGQYFLGAYPPNMKYKPSNIEYEENKSARLRNQFKTEVNLLIESPVKYQATLIKNNTKKNFETTCRRIRASGDVTDKAMKLRIDEIYNQAIYAIDNLEITTPEEMYEECQFIVDRANRHTDMVFTCIAVKERRKMGPCKDS